MSFDNAGTPAWIAPNSDQGWSYGYGEKQVVLVAGDVKAGAQCASASAKSGHSVMWATRQGRKVEANLDVTYFVDFHNDGPDWCFYNLVGGGYL
jgi:hypothetical protein